LIVLVLLVLEGARAGNILGVYDAGSSLAVVQYETDCSIMTNIGSVAMTIETANKCAYDAKHDILYAFGSDSTGAKSVYGINGTTAAITSVTPLPFHSVHLDYDPITGNLLVIGADTTGTAQYYLTIGSGELKFLNAVPPQYGNFLGEGSAFDDVNGIQWYNAFDNVAFVSYQVGLQVIGGVYQVVDNNNAGTPAFTGSSDGGMIGLGYDGNRTIVRWSSSSSSTAVTSKVVSSWDITYNSQNTLDIASNVLFAVLDNGTPDVDQFLVGIDMTSGRTRSAVLVAPNMYPWCSFFRS